MDQRPPIYKVSLTCGLMLVPLLACHAQSEDRCRDILQNGVRDEYSDVRNRNIRSSFQASLCSDYNQSSRSGSGGNLGVSIPIADALVGVKGGYSQDQVQKMGSKYCGDNASNLSDDDFTSMMKRVASEKVVEAWSNCMATTAGQGGLQSATEIDGKEITFKIKWMPRFGVNSVTVDDFFVKGATCDPIRLRDGVSIGTEWKLQHCSRNGEGPVIITVEAANNMGSTIQSIPGVDQKPPPPPGESLKSKCMQGSSEACFELSKQVRQTCGYGPACNGPALCWENKASAILVVKNACEGPNSNAQICGIQTNNMKSHLDMDCDPH